MPVQCHQLCVHRHGCLGYQRNNVLGNCQIRVLAHPTVNLVDHIIRIRMRSHAAAAIHFACSWPAYIRLNTTVPLYREHVIILKVHLGGKFCHPQKKPVSLFTHFKFSPIASAMIYSADIRCTRLKNRRMSEENKRMKNVI